VEFGFPLTFDRTASILRFLSNTPSKLSVFTDRLLAGALLLALVAYAYLGTFSRYMADDFSALRPVQTHGFFGAQITWYQSWTGRFSFSFLNSLFALLGPAMPRCTPGLLLILWLAAAVWASYQIHLLSGNISPSRVVLCAAFIIFATLETASNLSQSLYWQTAALTHFTPFIPLSLYVGLVGRGMRRKHLPRKVSLAFAAILTFVAGGLADAYVVFQSCALILAILALEVFAGAEVKSRIRAFLVIGLIGSLLALTIVLASPGNAIRQAFFPKQFSVVETVAVAMLYSLGFVAKLLIKHPLTFLVSLTLPLLMVMREFSVSDEPRWSRRLCIGLLLLTPVTVFLLIVCCTGASVYAISVMLPERARILLSLIFICGTVVWGRAAAEYLAGKLATIGYERKQFISRAASVLLLLVTLAPLISCFSTLKTSEQARSFAADWDRQDSQLKAARQSGIADVSVQQIGDFQLRTGKGPGDLYLRADPSFWINQVTASYYGLKSVRANEEPPR